VFFTKEFLPKVKRYFRRNLGAPFVIGFQILLLSAAGLLAVGNSSLAEGLAVCGYFLLVIGVIVQLFSFVWSRGEESEHE